MSPEHVKAALAEGWGTALYEFLDDQLLTLEEECRLMAFEEWYQLPLDDILRRYPTSLDRIQKARALREVLEGKVPSHPELNGSAVFNFQKGEKVLWIVNGVQYLEDKTRRHYTGGHHGVSVRIAKGVYYRVGTFKGYPVETTQRLHFGVGPLGISNKHIYFYSPQKSFRIRHDKIVSITPYSDGIGVQRDAATAKPQIFVSGDGWFLYNLVRNAPHVV